MNDLQAHLRSKISMEKFEQVRETPIATTILCPDPYEKYQGSHGVPTAYISKIWQSAIKKDEQVSETSITDTSPSSQL